MTPQEPIMVGRLKINYLIDGTASGGMGVFELTIPPESNVPPPHSHSNNDEYVYVLEGILRYSVDAVTRDWPASTTSSSDDIYFFRSWFFISGLTRSAV